MCVARVWWQGMASFILTFSPEPVEETSLPNISSAVFGIRILLPWRRSSGSFRFKSWFRHWLLIVDLKSHVVSLPYFLTDQGAEHHRKNIDNIFILTSSTSWGSLQRCLHRALKIGDTSCSAELFREAEKHLAIVRIWVFPHSLLIQITCFCCQF